MGIIYILIGALIISVTFLISAEFVENKSRIYFLKPLSTSLLVIIVATSFFSTELEFFFKLTVLVGLLFCMGGDVFLMFDGDKSFRAGLVSFLIGHVFYAATLIYHNGFFIKEWSSALTIGLISMVLFIYLYDSLRHMKIPVLLYVVVITVMLASAFQSFESYYFSEIQAWYLSIGALLFYVSDVILAVNKFKIPFKYHRLSLAFYYSGQLLIALSTHYFI